jgi:Nucleoside-diphosphate-sugar epimerases
VRALITGGAGFIGSHLAESLIGQGHSVSVLDDVCRPDVSRTSSIFNTIHASRARLAR